MTVRTQFRNRCKSRQEEAVIRQEYWARLSFEQQLMAIDTRLGDGLGAVKQRARITKQIIDRDAQSTASEDLVKEKNK